MNSEELNELAKTIAANLDLSKFKGDIVLHKEVETEIGNYDSIELIYKETKYALWEVNALTLKLIRNWFSVVY